MKTHGGSEGIGFERINARVMSAGRTLLLLRVYGLKPRGHVCNWPEFTRELLDYLEYNADENTLRMRAKDEDEQWPAPTSREIDAMDEALFEWIPGLGMYCKIRKIPHVAKTVGLRMLHHPDLNGRKFSLNRIAARFPSNPSKETVRCWYKDGIGIIAKAHTIAQAVENSS